MNPASGVPDPIRRNAFADFFSVGLLVAVYETSRVLLKTKFQLDAQGELDGRLRAWGEMILPGAGWATTAFLMGLLAWRCLYSTLHPKSCLTQVAGILLESLGLALALWVVARFWGRMLPELAVNAPSAQMVKQAEIWSQTASLTGAAIYEELVFRILLLGILYWVMIRFGTGLFVSGFCAILLSAIIFSMAHHQGTPQSSQEKAVFLFRTFCGSVLGLILLIRGPGTSIYSHTLYNLIAHFTAFGNAS